MITSENIKKFINTPIYNRVDNDWYVEPDWCVRDFMYHEQFDGSIHDPACGSGNIVKVARYLGYEASGSDIVDRCFGAVDDYIKNPAPSYDNMVTNPPYNLAEDFVHHSLDYTKHKTCILVRLAFLEGQVRKKTLFRAKPPTRVYVLSRRPSMPPGGTDIPATGGKLAYCWIVWEKPLIGKTEICWI